tara:strand:- start:24 stop:392 length:369 start_codon:yes stop_codon:yes gene_type:complete
MAKERTINEIRQTKEYYTGNIKPSKSFIKDQEAAKQMVEIDRQECELDPVEEAKILIVDKITKHFYDVMFEMVNEEMSKCYLFQSQNYLTEAGYELFEDEYFEFYHNHHGDIMYEVMQNITN